MHRTKWSVAALAALAALGAAGCDADSLTRINENPNSPRVAPAGPVFTTAARLAATRWLGSAYSLRATELVAQHLAEVQYPESDQYSRLRANSTGTIFDQAYTQELKDLTSVIQAGLLNNEPGQYGPALALRSWVYGYITDTWGDVPYTSALAGDSTAASSAPRTTRSRRSTPTCSPRSTACSRDLAARADERGEPRGGGPDLLGQPAPLAALRQHGARPPGDAPGERGPGPRRATSSRRPWPPRAGCSPRTRTTPSSPGRAAVNANSNPWSVDFQQRGRPPHQPHHADAAARHAGPPPRGVGPARRGGHDVAVHHEGLPRRRALLRGAAERAARRASRRRSSHTRRGRRCGSTPPRPPTG
jgi:hypothetical protein